MTKTKIGIIGCGNISEIYCQAGRNYHDIEVAACADLDPARARARAEEHNIPQALSVPELLADPAVEIIVNLTVPAVHATVSRQVLEAGKHVYSEKPLATTREEGAALLALAAARGLRVGCAPDTFLGAGLQTCRQILDQGLIGQPVGAAGWMLSNGPEGWHPAPEFFYHPGAGPMFDMGPYYLTALTALLGPVERVTGSARIIHAERVIKSQPKHGQMIRVCTATHIAGVLDFASGVVGTLTTSFDVQSTTLPSIEIYGTEGTLLVPDPNTFGGPVKVRRAGEEAFQEMPLTFPYEGHNRGLGVADMAAAIRSGRPHRADGGMAFHTLDLMIAFHEASAGGHHIRVGSSMQRPAPFPAGLTPGNVE